MHRDLREEHTIGAYRFEFYSEPAYKMENPDPAFARVFHRGTQVASPDRIGFVRMGYDPISLPVRQVPNAPLFIACPSDREHTIVFVYDTTAGVLWPSPTTFTVEEQGRAVERTEQLEARLRNGLGDERYSIGDLWPGDPA
jgi:hypothetical protein